MLRIINISRLGNTLHFSRAVTQWQLPLAFQREFHVSAARLKRRKTAEEKVGFRATMPVNLKAGKLESLNNPLDPRGHTH